MRRPKARTKKKARPAARVRPTPAPPIAPRLALREPPHAHIVCRQCGRIASVPVGPFDAAQLTAFASATPADWAVEGISLSITGFCPRCRQGLPSR